MDTLKSPGKWVGGKYFSAERIERSFPPIGAYDRYCEPCCGMINVFLARPYSPHIEEICNDLDGHLVNFWRQVQRNSRALLRRLRYELYSREIYYEYYRSLFNGTNLDELERAARWFVCLRSTGTGWLRKSPVGWNNRVQSISAYRNALLDFDALHDRLSYVVIDNRDVLATLKRYDSPRTLFYLDPPYMGKEEYYEVSKKGFPHEAMAHSLNLISGMAALSYYPHLTIEQWYASWRCISWQQRKPSQIQIPDRNDIATELLLCNYPEIDQSDTSIQQQLWSEV